MSPHKSTSRTAISDATIKPLAIPKACRITKTSTPKISDDAKYIKISRNVLKQGLELYLLNVGTSHESVNTNARAVVAFLSGVLEGREPEIAAQLRAILGESNDKLV